MRTKLLLLFFFCGLRCVFAQVPVISGDVLICPYTNGTIAIEGNVAYDSYTWYSKYWFTSDDYVAIPGADGPSFTYDWFTYDQSLFKVVVTIGGQTYESNVLQVDSYNWLPISMGFDNTDNVSINPDNGNVLLCNGTGFNIQVFDPYSFNIQWYRNGIAVAGANAQTLEVHEAGTYHVVASPPFCPDSVSSTEGLPIIVEINNGCNLAIDGFQANNLDVILSPNPVRDFVTIKTQTQPIDFVNVFDLTGQRVSTFKVGATTGHVSMAGLSSGVYILEVGADGISKKLKFVKE